MEGSDDHLYCKDFQRQKNDESFYKLEERKGKNLRKAENLAWGREGIPIHGLSGDINLSLSEAGVTQEPSNPAASGQPGGHSLGEGRRILDLKNKTIL